MSKKYMVRCDLEGVTGVVSYAQVEPNNPAYAFGKDMFMAELTALIKGLNDGGAESVTIYDEHYYGTNIDLRALPKNVTAICGKPPYRKDWAGGLDTSYTGLILLGFHSKRGTPDALLNHSYEPEIKNISINGIPLGEIGVEAAIAGDYQVPLMLVTGDSEGVAEARRLVPGVEGVVVKESLSETGALCYPLAVTTGRIYEAAVKVAKTPPETQPYAIGKGVQLEVELAGGPFYAAFKKLFVNQLDGQKAVITAESVTEAWSLYWGKKLACYAEMGR